jgi:hypothetical protein
VKSLICASSLTCVVLPCERPVQAKSGDCACRRHGPQATFSTSDVAARTKALGRCAAELIIENSATSNARPNGSNSHPRCGGVRPFAAFRIRVRPRGWPRSACRSPEDCPERAHRPDARDRNQRGDQAVFDGGDGALVFDESGNKFCKVFPLQRPNCAAARRRRQSMIGQEVLHADLRRAAKIPSYSAGLRAIQLSVRPVIGVDADEFAWRQIEGLHQKTGDTA